MNRPRTVLSVKVLALKKYANDDDACLKEFFVKKLKLIVLGDFRLLVWAHACALILEIYFEI